MSAKIKKIIGTKRCVEASIDKVLVRCKNVWGITRIEHFSISRMDEKEALRLSIPQELTLYFGSINSEMIQLNDKIDYIGTSLLAQVYGEPNEVFELACRLFGPPDDSGVGFRWMIFESRFELEVIEAKKVLEIL